MKKFLTVLLALSVVFTYSFSAAGAAFAAAPTDEEAFKAAVSEYKSSLTYNGDGYLAEEFNGNNWGGYVSKSVLETAIDAWADAVDLTDKDYLESNGKLNVTAKTAMATAIKAKVEKNQYAATLKAWNDLVATVDYAAYNKTGKANLMKAIEDGENAIAAAAAADKANTIDGIEVVASQIAALKNAIKANEVNLLTEIGKTLAEKVAAMKKNLDEKSGDFYVAAKEWLNDNKVTGAGQVAAKGSFDTDFNTLVAYFEDTIARYEEEMTADKTSDVDFTEFNCAVDYFFGFNGNPVAAKSNFQKGIKELAQKDVWVSYYEKEAEKAKAATNSDGTKVYYAADVDNLLANTKKAVEKDLWYAMTNGHNWGTLAEVEWAKLTTLANQSYDLQAYRKAATEKFTTGDYALNNWVGDRKDKVEALQDEYAEKILLAKSVADIDAIVKEAKEAIDKIMTKAEVDAIANKVASRIKAAGYLEDVTVSQDGKAEVATATGDGFATYFDVVVGPDTVYDSAIKAGALKAAAQVFVDAVLAEENDSITYKQIDEIIAANKDAAYAALKNVKTTDALETEAAAVNALIKALPAIVTAADKDQVLAAQAAMDTYLENAGAEQTDVSKYSTLKAALTTIFNAEKREVEKLIRLLPSTVTVADADQIAAARKAYDAFEKAYGDYAGNVFTNTTTLPSEDKLEKAEESLEKAKLDYAAKLIGGLNTNSTIAEIEAAKAAFDALTTESKLMLNDELYNKLMNAVERINAMKIQSVKAIKVVKNHSVAGKGYIKIAWSTVGDTSMIDGYRVYRSTKANSGYKYIFQTKNKSYKNTKSLKKGTRYYYKVRAYVELDGKRYFSDYSNKAYRAAK